MRIVEQGMLMLSSGGPLPFTFDVICYLRYLSGVEGNGYWSVVALMCNSKQI